MTKALSRRRIAVESAIAPEVVLGRQVQNAVPPRIGFLSISKFVAGWTIYLNHLIDFALSLGRTLSRGYGTACDKGNQN